MPPPDDVVTLIRRQPLDSEGTCTKCQNKAGSESIRCFGCDELYHVINCPPGGTKGQVTATFFKGWENMENHYPNVQYICDACRQDKQFKKDIIVSNRMCVIEDDLKGIRDAMTDKFQGLENMIKQIAQNNEFPQLPHPAGSGDNTLQGDVTLADRVKPTKPVKSTQSVIIIKKKSGPPADMDVIYNAAVETNAAVTKAYKNKSGDTVVVCETEESKQSMLPVLNNQMDKERFTVVTPAARRPTVTIIDIASNYSKTDLLARVKRQNASKFAGIDLDENNFKIIYTKPHARNRDLYKAVIRVSDEVRKAICNANNKLNIGLKSCPVFDEFFIRRCNRCQKLGHWVADCPEGSPAVCGKCSGNHETKNCTSDVARCHNCVQAKHRDTNHETSYYKCTAYMEAQKKLESTINYYKDNPKN
jgi:hypothetical protein